MTNRPIAQFDDDDLLHDVGKNVIAELVENNVDEPKAIEIAEALMERLRDNWGGQQIYIKKTDWGRGKIPQRDIEMYDKFNGHNHKQLAKEYDITLQRVYEIIKILHKIEVEKRQSSLFPEEEN